MTEAASRQWIRRGLVVGGFGLAAAGAATGALLGARSGGALGPARSRTRPVFFGEQLPAEVEVVVVGGGLVGCLTALTLAERGLEVVLCEKGVIAGEASGRSLGYIDGLFLDPAKVEIVARSKVLWADMNRRVGAETGFRQNGVVALFAKSEGLDAARGWLEAVRGGELVDARLLGSQEAANLAGDAGVSLAGALHQPSDAMAEPQLAAPAIAEAAHRAGAHVLQNCAVRGVETAGGRICGVVTERGTVRCKSVVIAGGAWSPLLARSLGLDLPQFMAFSSVQRSAGVRAASTPAIFADLNIATRRTIDGFYDSCRALGSVPLTPALIGSIPRLIPAWRRMSDQLEPVLNIRTFMQFTSLTKRWRLDQPSPFEKLRVLSPVPRLRLLDGVSKDLAGALPAFRTGHVVERWAGALTSTLDNMPVISAVEKRPGLFIGTGFYYGLTMAPAAGEALADLVEGNPPKIDLSNYRFSRFSDGSRLTFRD